MGGIASLLPMLLQKIAGANKGPMSEQIPGQSPGGVMQMPQMPSLTQMGQPQISPSMQQNQQMMQNAAPVFGQPNMTAGAMQGPAPGGKRVYGGDMGQTEWNTAGGRAMALTGSAMESFSNAFEAGEQKNWQRQAGEAEQLWQTYKSLNQAMADTQDPKAKQTIQKQLEQMMQDPKTQKILKKAKTDPTSAYGVGVQRAMAQSKAEAKQQADLEEMYAKIQLQQQQAQAEQARMAQEYATAHLRDVQASQEGQVTPKVAAELGSKEKIAGGELAQKQQQVAAQLKANEDHYRLWYDATNKRTEAMIQEAKIRAGAMKKSGSEAAKFYGIRYTGLSKQLDDLSKQQKEVMDDFTKQSKSLQDNAAKTLKGKLGLNTGIDQEVGKLKAVTDSKIQFLSQQHQQVQQQMQMLDQQIQQLTGAGVIEPPQQAQPEAAPPTDQPIVVSAGDMK